ncbi:GTP pyrophosphokinase family protein [Tepidibacillus infernus]|uniref:GTP pyrophosphokinase n=1 Tax=Tepidibacillus infernus TaxID=1806172 RepID=UPI003A1F1450
MEEISVNEEQWSHFFIPYEQAVGELVVKFIHLKKEYRKRKIHSPIEFVFGRVKTVNSILSKAKILNMPVDQEISEHIRDIAGIRIISQFVDDIDTVVQMIEQRSDMRIVEKKDYIRYPKKSGYRSYHVIVAYEVITINGPIEVYVEFQLRTMAMNFWATIEHSLSYKYDGKIPEHIQLRLTQAAVASAKLDSEMFEIRGEIIQAQLYFNLYREIQNLIQMIYLLGAISENQDLIEKANQYMNETENMDKLEDIRNQLAKAVEDANKIGLIVRDGNDD